MKILHYSIYHFYKIYIVVFLSSPYHSFFKYRKIEKLFYPLKIGNRKMDFKTINEKMQNIEMEYIKKLEQAKQEDNYDKIMGLFFELKFLRSKYKKQSKYIQKRDANKL